MAKMKKDRTPRKRMSEASLANLKPIPKGKSGNPGGRPKGGTLTDLLRKELDEICIEDKEKRTYRQLVVLGTIRLAIKGNPAALKEVWNRSDGKVPDKFEAEDGPWIIKMWKPKEESEEA